MRKQRAPPGEEVDSMEVSEKLKHFNSMTDKKVNKRETEIYYINASDQRQEVRLSLKRKRSEEK